jgi:hypothetical protein
MFRCGPLLSVAVPSVLCRYFPRIYSKTDFYFLYTLVLATLSRLSYVIKFIRKQFLGLT